MPLPGEIARCIGEDRSPTSAETNALAQRILRDISGTRSTSFLSADDDYEAHRRRSLRLASAALAGDPLYATTVEEAAETLPASLPHPRLTIRF